MKKERLKVESYISLIIQLSTAFYSTTVQSLTLFHNYLDWDFQYELLPAIMA